MSRHRKRLDSVDRTFLTLLAMWAILFGVYLGWGATILD